MAKFLATLLISQVIIFVVLLKLYDYENPNVYVLSETGTKRERKERKQAGVSRNITD